MSCNSVKSTSVTTCGASPTLSQEQGNRILTTKSASNKRQAAEAQEGLAKAQALVAPIPVVGPMLSGVIGAISAIFSVFSACG
jgi:hypothetical protein